MPESPIIELDSIDSTNNYAMQLIDANKAQHGLTIVAQSQTAGKGQRGKTWTDAPGQGLLMSIIVAPTQAISEQFAFNASVAVAIVSVLQYLDSSWDVKIKWPNDIIVNDKKAGGILIENVLRGSRWSHAVIGLGLNVKQEHFPQELPYATSLKIATGKDFDIRSLRDNLRDSILAETTALKSAETAMKQYNEHLYRCGLNQKFNSGGSQWEATIRRVHTNGTLEVELEDGSALFYHHGQVVWEWA